MVNTKLGIKPLTGIKVVGGDDTGLSLENCNVPTDYLSLQKVMLFC